MKFKVFSGFSITAAGIIFFGLIMSYYQDKLSVQEVNLTENMDILFSGSDGAGTAVEITDHLDPNTEETKALEQTLTYTLSPEGNYSNGQTVTVTVGWDSNVADNNHLKPVAETREFIVSGLTQPSISEAAAATVSHLVDGVEISSDMDLNEDEQQAYADYINSISQGSSETPAAESWMKGNGKAETHLNNKTFQNYTFAYNYGLNSSQEFKIHTFTDEEGRMRYECIFKTDGQ